MAAGRPRADRGRKQGSQDQVRTPSPTIAIDASFAFAAPKDGPQAALAWERRIYYVPIQDIQSMQALWTYAYRYWITDKFLISTYDPSIEMDHRGDTHLEPAAVHELDERSHTRSQYQRPSPSEHITKVHDHEAIIDRGVQELGLSQKALENLKQKYQGDTGLVIKELCAMVLEKQAADEVVSTAADVLTDTHTRVEPEPEDHRGAPDQGDPDDPGPAGPDGQADDQQGGRLTDDQLRKVIREIENAQIETSTMQEIVHTRLGADKITNVTLDAITNAATAAQLKLPTDTPMDEVLFAVIRNAAVTIEDRKSKEEKNGSGAPAPEAHTESGNGTEKGDNESFIYDGMAKSSENELREMNPELATKLAKRTYPTTEARVNAFDAALTGERTRTAHESARATMTPNTPSAAKPSNEAKKTAKPSSPDSRPGDDTKEKTMEEEIEKVIKENKLTKNEVSTLRGLSRGNNHKLLKLLQNLASNNT